MNFVHYSKIDALSPFHVRGFKMKMDQTVVSEALTPISKRRHDWLDIAKGLAILAVLAHHYPGPATDFRFRLTDNGFHTSLLNTWNVARSTTGGAFDAVLLSLSALGYQGVHVFLVASGCGLALADKHRGKPLSFCQFLRRRATRLLPAYWLFVILLAVIGASESLLHWHPRWLLGLSKHDLLINLLLIRDFRERWVWIYPGTLWFIPLIIELYLVFPVVAHAMRKHPSLTFLCCIVVTLTYRYMAVLGFGSAPVGVITSVSNSPLMFFPARLGEFVFGMWIVYASRIPDRPAPVLFATGLLLWSAGTVLSCYRVGWIACDLLVACGLSVVVYHLSVGLARAGTLCYVFVSVGQRSYSVYLMHSLLIPTALSFRTGRPFVIGLIVYYGAAYLLAVGLDLLLLAGRSVTVPSKNESQIERQPR